MTTNRHPVPVLNFPSISAMCRNYSQNDTLYHALKKRGMTDEEIEKDFIQRKKSGKIAPSFMVNGTKPRRPKPKKASKASKDAYQFLEKSSKELRAIRDIIEGELILREQREELAQKFDRLMK